MFDIKENLAKLPDSPGVYLHKDELGQVIYVGKAISLRNRVRQYFQSSYQNSNPKVKAMAENIASFEYIRCASEMEALILECNLIKKYIPKYNVLLRDDKTYPFIMVTTSEQYPRVVKTRRGRKDGNRYFGPYSDVGAVNRTVELLSGLFALKQCVKTEFPANHRPCLNYHIDRCRGVCLGNVPREEYMETIQEIIQYLGGKDQPLKRKLKDNMEAASEDLRFEEAAKWRDALASLTALEETQRAAVPGGKDMDIVLAIKAGERSLALVFPVRQGKLSGRESFRIQAEDGDSKEAIITEFIKQYYSEFQEAPPEIVVRELPEKELLEAFLSEEGRPSALGAERPGILQEKDGEEEAAAPGDARKDGEDGTETSGEVRKEGGRQGRRVRIVFPQKGSKRQLLNMAKNDAAELAGTILDKAEEKAEQERAVRKEMSGLLEAAGYPVDPAGPERPFIVESYDISNTNGVDSVGAMVVFSGLERVRKNYRRFKIKTVEGPDDYASLMEVIYRRYRRYQAGDAGFSLRPDIIMMDGGIGQLHAARKVLDALRLDIPVVGMAKDDSHRTRAIVFDDGSELPLRDHPVLFRYAGTIQEEVHRYAIEYHHNLHGKRQIRSILDDIEGVGPRRRNDLLYHFKTIDDIRKASIEELMEVPSINEKVARSIKEYFR